MPLSPDHSARGARRKRSPGGPRRWRTADKAAHLAAFAVRGGTIATYCAAGVPPATFTVWQRETRLARGTARPGRRPHPTFARVDVVAPPMVSPIVRNSPPRLG